MFFSCQKHAIYLVFVRKLSVWSVNAEQWVFTRFEIFCACILAHIRNGHISLQKCVFFMYFSEQCKKQAIWVVFVHKLSVRCVNAEQCVFSHEMLIFQSKNVFFDEQCLKHTIVVAFRHKLSVSCVFYRKWPYLSLRTCFLMPCSEQCQTHAICVVFVHKLNVWCVFCMYRCTNTKWSYFSPKSCFLMYFGEQCKKHSICVFLGINWVFGEFCAFFVAHTRNGHIQVQKCVFWCTLLNNVKGIRFSWFFCIN